MTADKKIPATIEELFEGWPGEYQMPADLEEWQNMQPEGQEL